MEVKAYQKNIRTSPRKLRLVADTVRRLPPQEAILKLRFMHKRAAGDLRKVLRQAVSNAVNNHNLSEKVLRIKHLIVEEGPRLKRWRAVSRGRAHRILKKMSHVKVILEAKEEQPTSRMKSPKVEAKKQKKTRGK